MQSEQIRITQFSPETNYLIQEVEDPSQKQSYLDAHNARKKAQEEAKILRNRIALLRSEEGKVKRKIEDTKTKAREITQIQERNNEATKKKDEAIRAKVEEIKKRMEVNVLTRSRSKETIQNKIQQIKESNKQAGDKIRKEKEETEQAISSSKEQTYIKKVEMYRTIKEQHNELKEKKEKFIETKIQATKKVVDDRIAYEQVLMKESEKEIADLEKEELEVIQRLQCTQLQQKNAFSELENLLNSSRIRPKTPEKHKKIPK